MIARVKKHDRFCKTREAECQLFTRAGSSVGRAAALQAVGHRFEPCCAHFDHFSIGTGGGVGESSNYGVVVQFG